MVLSILRNTPSTTVMSVSATLVRGNDGIAQLWRVALCMAAPRLTTLRALQGLVLSVHVVTVLVIEFIPDGGHACAELGRFLDGELVDL